MNYTLLLIIILIISSIGHIYILNKRVMNKLVSFLPATPHAELDTSKYTSKGRVDNLRILLTVMFLFSPLLLFKSLRKASIEDIFTASVLLAIITIISIVFFWFSATRLKRGKFGYKAGFLDNKSSDSFLNNEEAHIKLSARSIRSYNRKRTKKENLETFRQLLNNLDSFKYWLVDFNQFELSNFQTLKGQVMDDNHAWLTLIICFHEEILKTRVKRLTSEYYEIVNRKFLNENTIGRTTWCNFRKSHMDNGAIKDLKRSDFYKEIALFTKKVTEM